MNINYFTPVLTLMNEDGTIDINSNENLINNLIANGIKGFVVLGSTSEFYAMTKDERKSVIDLFARVAKGRAKLIIGTGGLVLSETLELTNYAEKAGADAVIVMSPFFNRYSDQTIKYYYDKVAESTKLDVYIYNFPERTGYDISADLTLKLRESNPNIIGYKDSARTIEHTREIISKVKSVYPEFEVYSGYDDNFLFNVISGGNGAMGALSNVAPEFCSEWVENFKSGDYEECFIKHNKMGNLMKMYSISEPFMITFKKALDIRGIKNKVVCREPQIPFDDNKTDEIKLIMNNAAEVR